MTSRRIVLDANILIRAVLGVKVGGLIAKYANAIEFCAPSIAFEDADAHLPDIMAKRGIRAAELSLGLDAVRLVVEEVPAEATEPMLPDLEDKDFFGSGVATWTSDLVELYLLGDGAVAD